MRKLTYYVACSVDGYIAHIDGSHDGFSQDAKYLTSLFNSFPETLPTHLREVMGIHEVIKCLFLDAYLCEISLD